MTRESIAALLTERDSLAARMTDLDRRIFAASREYWREKVYRVMPRVEAMRREVGLA